MLICAKVNSRDIQEKVLLIIHQNIIHRIFHFVHFCSYQSCKRKVDICHFTVLGTNSQILTRYLQQ